MSKIKHIHCFGTSYTAGGGYEFTAKCKYELYDLYKHLDEELTRYNFSWPGQLNKLIKSHKIKVHNHAESGYGNERMYRIVYDIIQDKKFKKEENLFLLEFSGVGRQELYLKPLDDYVIFNYNDNDPFNKTLSDVAHRYFYDTAETRVIIDDSKKIVDNYHKLVFDYDEKHKSLERNNNFFIRYLQSLNIEFLITQHPYHSIKLLNGVNDFEYLMSRSVTFEGELIGDMTLGLETYYREEGFTITKETHGVMEDGHASLLGNKNIALNVFNNLIDYEYITDSKKEILPSDTEFCNPPSPNTKNLI